jgi:primosomal protein N' (replication factor Y)
VTVKGGLKLKQEVAPASIVAASQELPIAHLWVDSGVYHLDHYFSYIVPENLSDQALPGTFVIVPFHGRELTALVIERTAGDGTSGLKSIIKVLAPSSVLSKEIIELVGVLAEKYAAHPFDVLRSVVPDRAVSEEKNAQLSFPESSVSPPKKNYEFLQLPPAQKRSRLIAQRISELQGHGGVLTILPDSREVSSLSLELSALGIAHKVLDSALSRGDLYANFLSIRSGESQIVIGTRSAIFAPVHNLASIVIYDEGSEHLYERRSPGWNVRDIALYRSNLRDLSITFIGYSPSAEVARLIEDNVVTYRAPRARTNVKVISPIHGELIPSSGVSLIKKALEVGPVLFLIPMKGYAQAIRCAKCRTISRCECGGAHEQRSQNSPITCSHCEKVMNPWSCSWCNEVRPSLASRGADRHLHEIALLFPGRQAFLSTADHPIATAESHGIYLATPHMAPTAEKGYAAVVVVEGDRFLSQSDLRAQERARAVYFSHAALASDGSAVLLIQEQGHSIATELSQWNSQPVIRRELEERKQLHLPPFVRAISLTLDTSETTRLKSALEGARAEGRIPDSTKILGPIPEGEKSRMILTVDRDEGNLLVSTLHEFMRRRSASKKSLPSLRIDPYSLSR